MTADGQIKSFFDRWERLEDEKKQIADLLKDLFAEAKGFGYDTKALRAAFRLKVKEDLDNPADAEFEAVVETYLSAINAPSSVTRDTRMLAREKIEEIPAAGTGKRFKATVYSDGSSEVETTEYDRETGEILDAKLVETIAKGVQTEVGRAALIAAVDILIEQEEAEEEFRAKAGEEANTTMRAASNDPVSRTDDVRERQHASTVEFADDCTTGGKEQSAAAAAPVGDATAYAHGIPANSKTDAAISRPGFAPLDRPEIENRSDEEASVSNASGEMQDEIAIHLPTNSEIAPATQGEAEVPSAVRVSPTHNTSSAAANIGGDHVDARSLSAATAGALVNRTPATRSLRPHCQHRELCRSGTRDHCHSCKVAMREREEA